MKILGVLSKTTTSTGYPEYIARIVEEGLLSTELNPASTTTAGREASKFRGAIFTLVNFVARQGRVANLSTVSESLVGNLKGFIQDQGWPTPDRDQDLEIRGYGYETIGLLAKAAPEKILLEPSLELLEWLFRSLRDDSSGKDVAVSIDEALSSVLAAFAKPFDTSLHHSFRQILLKYSASTQFTSPSGTEKFTRNTRYTATRFANRCLPYDDIIARWIDILAVSGGSNERHEVVEEGKKGLDPHWFSMSSLIPASEPTFKQLSFPDFDKLVHFIFTEKCEDEDEMDVDDENDVNTRVRLLQKRFPNVVPTVISFCTNLAMQAALAEKDIRHELSEDWARRLEALMSTDLRTRQAFRSYTAKEAHAHSLASILRLCFDKLSGDELNDVGRIGETFVRLLSLCPQTIWSSAGLLHNLRSLQPSILSNNPDRREAAAHAYGLLASHEGCDTGSVAKSQTYLFEKLMNWNTAVGGGINQTAGAVLALGYYFSRLAWRSSTHFNHQHQLATLLETCTSILKDSRDTTLKDAVFLCLDQLSLFHVLTPSTITRFSKFQDIVQNVYDSAKTGTTSAILALGHMSMITEETDDADSNQVSDYTYIADKLHELHEVRQPEVQFSVGEALSCFACGWDTKALTAALDIEHPRQYHDPWDTPLITPSGPGREKTLAIVLEKTLKGCRQTKPSLRKASVIWLLCLLQYCGHKQDMQDFLPQCQTAFKLCLSDRDEVVQEAASRGLGLVYEKGDRQLKDDLVRDLVSSFSDNKSKMAGTVSEDTQLFEPGALPTGDGSVTTYKDILSLASEVGDSSLVYRFMSLASNNSIWSSRAAFGRFGLSNIFSDSSVDGYLAENPKLYPKLYRYRYAIGTHLYLIWY